jgi:hypothetical protein
MGYKNSVNKQLGVPTVKVMEREFQATVIEMAKAFGWECFYIPDSAKSGAVGRPKGWPDLTLCHPKMFILIYAELKSDDPKSQPSPEQVKWLSILDNCSEIVQLWRPRMWDHIEAVLQGPPEKTYAALNNLEQVGMFIQ